MPDDPDDIVLLIWLFVALLSFVVGPLILRIRRVHRRQRAGAARPMPKPQPQPKQFLHWELEEDQVQPARRAPPAQPTGAAVPVTPAPPVSPRVEVRAPMPTLAPQAPPKPLSPGRLAGRLEELSVLQRAVAWAEILGPPRGLEEPPR